MHRPLVCLEAAQWHTGAGSNESSSGLAEEHWQSRGSPVEQSGASGRAGGSWGELGRERQKHPKAQTLQSKRVPGRAPGTNKKSLELCLRPWFRMPARSKWCSASRRAWSAARPGPARVLRPQAWARGHNFEVCLTGCLA